MFVQHEPQQKTRRDGDEADQVEQKHHEADRVETAEAVRGEAQHEGDAACGHGYSVPGEGEMAETFAEGDGGLEIGGYAL